MKLAACFEPASYQLGNLNAANRKTETVRCFVNAGRLRTVERNPRAPPPIHLPP
jgi:hypothetical protein